MKYTVVVAALGLVALVYLAVDNLASKLEQVYEFQQQAYGLLHETDKELGIAIARVEKNIEKAEKDIEEFRTQLKNKHQEAKDKIEKARDKLKLPF